MLKGWHGQPAVYKSTAGTDVADCMLLNGRSPKDRRTARQCLFVSELNLCTTLSPIPSRFKAKMSVPRPLQSLPTLSDCFRSLMAKAAMAVGSGNLLEPATLERKQRICIQTDYIGGSARISIAMTLTWMIKEIQKSQTTCHAIYLWQSCLANVFLTASLATKSG